MSTMHRRARGYGDRFEFCYRAFGLTIGSGLEIPELAPLNAEEKRKPGDKCEPDVIIEEGTVPERLDQPRKAGTRLQIKPGHFLFKVDNVAGYYVSNGNRVVVQPFPGSREVEVRSYLLGSVLGALVHQRSSLPLHSSAIVVNGQCVLFCGLSGAGKSTIARAFSKRGYPLHTDDMSVIAPGKNNRFLAYPGYPGFKLWEDALFKTGDDSEAYHRLRESLNKFAVPAGGHFNLKPLPVKKVYVLCPDKRSDIRIAEPQSGLDKFNALKSHVYKRRFVRFMGNQEAYFKTLGTAGNHIPLARVYRPRTPFLLNELADALETDFLKGES